MMQMQLVPNMASANQQVATLDGDINDPGKMFVGGLSWTTSEEKMRDYFSKFGDVLECCIMQDPITKRSRGFGFIKFADPDSVDRVVDNNHVHVIDGKKVDPKRAVPKNQSKIVSKTKKVFLGGLPPDTSEDDIRAYFGQYGEIEEVMLMYDKNTQRLRGFGFVKFSKEESADDACREHYHEIKGKMCEAKKAQPKEVMNQVATTVKPNTNMGLVDNLPLLYRTQSLIAYNPAAAAYSAALAQSLQGFGAASSPSAAGSFYPMLMPNAAASLAQACKKQQGISNGGFLYPDPSRAMTPAGLACNTQKLTDMSMFVSPQGQLSPQNSVIGGKTLAGTPPANGLLDLYQNELNLLGQFNNQQQFNFTDTSALIAAFNGYQ